MPSRAIFKCARPRSQLRGTRPLALSGQVPWRSDLNGWPVLPRCRRAAQPIRWYEATSDGSSVRRVRERHGDPGARWGDGRLGHRRRRQHRRGRRGRWIGDRWSGRYSRDRWSSERRRDGSRRQQRGRCDWYRRRLGDGRLERDRRGARNRWHRAWVLAIMRGGGSLRERDLQMHRVRPAALQRDLPRHDREHRQLRQLRSHLRCRPVLHQRDMHGRHEWDGRSWKQHRHRRIRQWCWWNGRYGRDRGEHRRHRWMRVRAHVVLFSLR